MKLRVRVRSQTFRLELEGDDPSVKELKEKISLLLEEEGVRWGHWERTDR